MMDTIYRQNAIDAICAICGNDCDKSEFLYNAPQFEQVIICPEHYALTQLPSVHYDLRFRIGEILVDESKGHISSEIAIEKIRKLMRDNEDGQRR